MNNWKEKLAWTIISFWAIAFVAGITFLIIYCLIIDTIAALIVLGVVAVFVLTAWALTYIVDNDL